MVRGLTARCWPRCSTKKRCTSAANDGVVCSPMTALLRRKRFEAIAGRDHQVGNTGEVPIGIGDLSMADIGGQRDDRIVDIRTFVLPALHSPANEGVAQIVNANLVIGSTSNNICVPT